ncbi:hypothetical protein B296_00024813 [Ensete ventricosum]|uniref:Uncharacterized protein n=1 Tax=Ensete ventricosum TaxID=4639 RepID=A0A426YLI9_ENSVE|nr:hypothetical protein B296_00024813 [Ensete ventricosum]
MSAPLSDFFPYISMSIFPKRLCVLAILHTAQLGPPRLYDEYFCVCLSRFDTTMSRELILPKPYGTHAYPSAKVSLPRDLLGSLRLTKEKTGQKMQF